MARARNSLRPWLIAAAFSCCSLSLLHISVNTKPTNKKITANLEAGSVFAARRVMWFSGVEMARFEAAESIKCHSISCHSLIGLPCDILEIKSVCAFQMRRALHVCENAPEGPSALLDKTFSISCLRVRHQCSSRESLALFRRKISRNHPAQAESGKFAILDGKDNVSLTQSKQLFVIRSSSAARPTKGPDCWHLCVHNLPIGMRCVSGSYILINA